MIRSPLTFGVLAVLLLSGLAAGVPATSASTTITIQPSNGDTYVDASNPTLNYGSLVRLKVDGRFGSVRRTLVSFDLSSIPAGMLIISSIFRLYMFSPPAENRTLAVYQINSNWTENTVVWNTQPSFSSQPADTQKVGTLPASVTWNVTSIVEDAYTNPSAWFGLLVKDMQEASRGSALSVSFYSRESSSLLLRPALDVTYAIPIPEIPLWAALPLTAGGVVIVWRRKELGTRLGRTLADQRPSRRISY